MAPDSEQTLKIPDINVSVKEVFGLDTKLTVAAFSTSDDHVPEIDPAYCFDPDTTIAILAGFSHNRRVMIQGYHGTGNQPISSKWQRVLIGLACGLILTAISVVSTWSARMPLCCVTALK